MARVSMLIVLVAFLSCSSAAAIEGLQNAPQPKVIVKSISTGGAKSAFDTSAFDFKIDLQQEYETGDPRVDVILSINDEVDALLTNVTASLSASYNSVSLPDHEITFEYRPLLITYIGTLTLTQGNLQGLSTVSRNGDAIMLYTVGGGKEDVTIPLRFDELIATYHFQLELIGETIEGTVEGYFNDVTAIYHLLVEDDAITSEELEVDTGSLTIDVNSSDLAILLFPNVVEEVSEDALESSTRDIIAEIIGDAVGSAVKSELGVEE